jgi:hypothetical protein
MSSATSLVEWLTQNPWFGLAFFAIGVISLLLTVVFHFMDKKEKKPCYIVQSISILRGFSSRFKDLELLYGGEKIENFTVTKVLFWNGGRDTIHSQDIAEADPLRFIIGENRQILDARVIQAKTDANEFRVEVSEDKLEAIAGFNYVDRNEGAVFQILHTGESGEDIRITGRFKGTGGLVGKELFPEMRFIRIARMLVQFSTKERSYCSRRKFIGVLLLSAYGFFLLSSLRLGGIHFTLWRISVWSFLALLYVPLGIMMLRKGAPKGFDAFEENLRMN